MLSQSGSSWANGAGTYFSVIEASDASSQMIVPPDKATWALHVRAPLHGVLEEVPWTLARAT